MIPKRLQTLLDKYSAPDRERAEAAYLTAEQALEGETRGNGHPFIEHPVDVACIVAEEIGLMPDAVVAVFLHEASRRHPELLAQMQRQYSPEIMTMVDGLNKISDITPKQTRLQAEIYRKLIVSYSKDPRVTLIKLADRLEIMRQLHIFPRSSVMRKVTETIMLYVPLAHQLGLYNLKSELEDLYFRYSDPEHYRAITNKLKATENDRKKLVREFIRPLERQLSEKYVYTLKVRTKTAYSIWRKMQKQGVPFEEVYDVFAIRFIVEAPPEKEHDYCWDIYSLVTREYRPHTERLRDWISHPKPNGYESLHTTVTDKDGVHIEVQIRSVRMDRIAENGHASHWSYKGIKSVQGLDQWLLNVKNMLNSSQTEPYTRITPELNEIFVFTPTGDIRPLPKGASVLDFAFTIHSNLGVHCSGARVNGKVVPIREELHTGDVVEIMSSKNQRPSADWLNIVVSTKARNRIKNKLKEEENKRSALGREMLERRMKNWKEELTDEVLSELTRHFRLKSIGEFCVAIHDGRIDLQEIKNHLQSPGGKAETPDPGKADSPRPRPSRQENTGDYLIINDKLNNIDFRMAKCCNPIFGDDVFGFVSVTGGIKIHRISCPNAARLIENYPYRIQKVKWRQVSTTTQFQTALKIIMEGEISSGQQIIECANQQMASVRSFSIEERSNKTKGNFNVMLGISVSNNGHLDRVISAIRKVKGVATVLRTAGK